MKKIILFFTAVILSATLANAQTPIRYQGEVDAGYSIGTGLLSQNRVNLHWVNGIRVGKYFSTGLGLGFDYYHQMYDKGELVLPIFLNLKGYLPVTEKVSPFFSFDIGASVGLTEGVSGLSGLLCTPAVGCAFKTTKKSAFLVSLGYNVQQISESGVSINVNAVSIKLGYQF
ncbi:hypothetical protein [Alistipes sp.]|uniref:hypothetical protein n=1 Tax=Alistipes sp. TaxID=1872444 RepID=UPI003AB88751